MSTLIPKSKAFSHHQIPFLSTLISDIGKKKELTSLPKYTIELTLQKIIAQNPKFITPNLHPKSKEYKQILKLTREKLRRDYGLFRIKQTTSANITTILKNYVQKPSTKLLQELLRSHESTKERLPIYPQLYPQIFNITGKPDSIIDLACGLNPLSIPYLKIDINRLKYHAYDISTTEIDLIKNYFNYLKNNNHAFIGTANVCDLRESIPPPVSSLFPYSSIVFCFKILDIIDQGKGHTKSEQLLDSIHSKFIVVSFATRTMSGKPMTAPKRQWMEWLCNRKKWKYTILEFENELFYIIQK